jgi:hypothetical protein
MEHLSSVGLAERVTRQELRDLEALMNIRIEAASAKAAAAMQRELRILTERLAFFVVIVMGLVTGLVISGMRP